MQTTNLLAAMFNIDECKKAIENCPKDEVIILLGHYSINKPKYNEDTDPETADWDFQELEELLECTLYVSDYDDLIADPHGIYNN